MKKAMIWGISLAFVVTGVQAQSLDDAKKAIDAEQFAQAKQMLETLVKNKPKDGENYFYLGLVYIENDHLDSAKAVFEQGKLADKKDRLNTVGEGILELYQGNENAATAKFAEATEKLKRKQYLELYHIGRAYIDAPEPNYQKAVEYLDQAKAKNAEDPMIPLALGDAYYGLDQASPAYVNYRDASLLDNTLTRAKVQLQVITRLSHAWQEAIDGLKTVAEEAPEYAPTYRELAETYHAWADVATTIEDHDARNQEAVKFYKQYMDKTDYTIDSRIRYADFLVYVNDYEELQVQATELAQLEDVNPKILRYLGYSAYQNGQFQESKDALDQLFTRIEADRIISRDYLHLGLADVRLASQNDPTDVTMFDDGIEQLKKAVEIDSSLADNLNDVGKELFGDGKYLDASKVFGIAASTPASRNFVYDNFYLGYAAYLAVATKPLADRGEADKQLLHQADTAFGVVIDKAPTTQDAYLYRANVNNLLDDTENPTGLAEPYFLKYIEMVEEQGDAEIQRNKNKLVDAYSTIAVVSVKRGDYQKGRDLLGEILKLDPENAWAKQTLQYLEQAETAAAPEADSTGE